VIFSKPKPTVTPEDQSWIEAAFIWFEEQYSREYLQSIKIIEPTKEYFNYNFNGSKKDAEFVVDKVCEYMLIKDADISLYFFSDAPIQFSDEGITITQSEEGTGINNNYALGKYSEKGINSFEIGIELSLLKNPISLIATVAHELSHLILLGEGRIDQNDEELTDLNCIALGFGIFISNSIFNFQQWHGTSHQGWSANRQGYIPEQVAAYAMALFQNYQKNEVDWDKYLNKSVRKMYLKNIKYLEKTTDQIQFK
jgi:hypothetical protein